MKSPDIYDTASWHHGYGEGYASGQKDLRERMEWNKLQAETNAFEAYSKKEHEYNDGLRKVLLELGRRIRAVASEMSGGENKDEFLRLAKWARRLHDAHKYTPKDFFAFIEDKEYPL